MPQFKYPQPDGRTYYVTAKNQADADAGFAQIVSTSPEAFAKPGVRAALKDLPMKTPTMSDLVTGKSKGLDTVLTAPSGRALNAASLGGFGQLDALAHGVVTGVRNALPIGQKPGYSAADAYNAMRLAQHASNEQFHGDHPIAATAIDVLGSLGMPGGATVGKFVLGKAAPALAAAGIKQIPLAVRAGQVTRAGVVGAGLGATQGALTAAPGDAAHDAAVGAATATAMAPVAWLGAKGVSTVAPKIAALSTKYLSPTIDAVGQIGDKALSKLQGALAKEGVTPDALQASLEKLSAGGKNPSLIDVLTDAGAGPRTAKLISTAGASPDARKTASQYATSAANAVPAALTAHTLNTLPVSEGRPVTHLSALNDAATQASKIADDAHAQALADAKVSQTQAAQTPMQTGVAPEEGGEAVHAELNKAFDASRKVHEDAFKVVDEAHPESAIVADSQRAPLATDIMSKVAPYTAEDFSSSNTLLKKLDGLKEGAAAPAPTGDETAIPPGYAANQTAVQPLTVRRLRDLDRWTGAQVSKMGSDNPEAIQFIVAQNAIRDNLAKLSDEGHIEGDPNVVSALNTAINAYAEHKKTFGDGLVSDLTERNNRKDDRPAIPSYAASEHIFGSGDNLKPLTNVVPDLENIRRIVSPDAFGKLQAEAAGRYGPQHLLDYAKAHPTAGETIFSPDTRAAAQNTINSAKSEADASVGQARVAAQNAADAAQGATASNAALDTGAGVLKTPAVDFSAQMEAHAPDVIPHAQTAARQEILNLIGRNPTNAISAVQTPVASDNLSRLFDPDVAAALQEGFTRAAGTADTAKNLEAVVNSGAKPDSLFSPTDLAYLHRGVANAALKKVNALHGVSPAEGQLLLNSLTGDADTGVAKLTDIASKRASGYVPPEITPLVAKSLGAYLNANPTAVQDLKTKYGLDLPTDFAPN